MKLTSSAFEHEGKIPAKYTCDGRNILAETQLMGRYERLS